jgi:hypothetical protein
VPSWAVAKRSTQAEDGAGARCDGRPPTAGLGLGRGRTVAGWRRRSRTSESDVGARRQQEARTRERDAGHSVALKKGGGGCATALLCTWR